METMRLVAAVVSIGWPAEVLHPGFYEISLVFAFIYFFAGLIDRYLRFATIPGIAQ